MNVAQLKIVLRDKTITELKNIIYDVYKKIPEAKDHIDSIVTIDKETVRHNTEKLLKRYKTKITNYIFPEDFETFTQEDRALKLIKRIRKKAISPEFTIESELHYIISCKDFILTYGYFDEDYYITMDEMFESMCRTIKKHRLLSNFEDQIQKLIAFGNEYGFEFANICNDLGIYKRFI